MVAERSSTGNNSGSRHQYQHGKPRHYEDMYSPGYARFSRKPPADTIWFYDRDEDYYEFTNFFPAYINLKGKQWPTTEHYFQAQKFATDPNQVTDQEDEVRKLDTPREAFDYVRKNEWVMTYEEWNLEKNKVMRAALLAKFQQNLDLQDLLLGTGYKKLVEHTYKDKYWGDGGDGTGKNTLGILLMSVRDQIRKELAEPNLSNRSAAATSAAQYPPSPPIAIPDAHNKRPKASPDSKQPKKTDRNRHSPAMPARKEFNNCPPNFPSTATFHNSRSEKSGQSPSNVSPRHRPAGPGSLAAKPPNYRVDCL